MDLFRVGAACFCVTSRIRTCPRPCRINRAIVLKLGLRGMVCTAHSHCRICQRSTVTLFTQCV